MKYKPAGITQQLAEYILKNLKKGYTLDALKYSLESQGYSKISVENAVDYANKQLAEKIPPIKERPEIIYKVMEDSDSIESITNKSQKIQEVQQTQEEQESLINANTEKKSFWQRVFG